jgi:hypothetical protein
MLPKGVIPTSIALTRDGDTIQNFLIGIQIPHNWLDLLAMKRYHVIKWFRFGFLFI